jgi:hypothetical protein
MSHISYGSPSDNEGPINKLPTKVKTKPIAISLPLVSLLLISDEIYENTAYAID